ncbi:hypothetical protein KKE03_03935 [Patescibacteria group bacterium]|nr:hypothetical protein [Patescibacteria group bacterium]
MSLEIDQALQITSVTLSPEANFGEVFAEVCQGFRNAVAGKKISAEEAQKRCSQVYIMLALQQLSNPGMQFEEGSTQLEQLVPPGRFIIRPKTIPSS